MERWIDWIVRRDEAIINRFARTDQPKTRAVMQFLSHTPGWRQIVLAVVILGLIFGNSQTRWRIGYLFLAVLLSDQTCNLLKALTKRNRPDETGPREGGFWERLGSYSFPSSHAANNFAVALLCCNWWPYIGYPFLVWAVAIAVSRVYLRSHYPSDVCGGALVGLAVAAVLLWGFKL